MKRTKEWWAALEPWERSHLMAIEKSEYHSSGLSGYLPDDCGECPNCSQPVLGSGLCSYCDEEAASLIRKANAVIAPTLDRPTCPKCHDAGLMRSFDVTLCIPVEWIGFFNSDIHKRQVGLSSYSMKLKRLGDFIGMTISCGYCGYQLSEDEAAPLNDTSIPALSGIEEDYAI